MTLVEYLLIEIEAAGYRELIFIGAGSHISFTNILDTKGKISSNGDRRLCSGRDRETAVVDIEWLRQFTLQRICSDRGADDEFRVADLHRDLHLVKEIY